MNFATLLLHSCIDNPKGYFVYNHESLANSQDLFAQLWKEYALSDSRYLTSDPFLFCVEAITVVSFQQRRHLLVAMALK